MIHEITHSMEMYMDSQLVESGQVVSLAVLQGTCSTESNTAAIA